MAGRFAELLFAFGMVGTGILAVPVMAGSSAYVAAQTFRFREGLGEKPLRAPKFYGVIGAGILVGIAMNLLHVDAIKALFRVTKDAAGNLRQQLADARIAHLGD